MACTACYAAKVKCDLKLQSPHGKPCSRCAKMNIAQQCTLRVSHQGQRQNRPKPELGPGFGRPDRPPQCAPCYGTSLPPHPILVPRPLARGRVQSPQTGKYYGARPPGHRRSTMVRGPLTISKGEPQLTSRMDSGAPGEGREARPPPPGSSQFPPPFVSACLGLFFYPRAGSEDCTARASRVSLRT